MARGRRSVGLDDPSGWVFNRMADVYDARPPYPDPLVEALAAGATGGGRRVVDIGAGVGHLALPLAARGFHVTAIEPALAMLGRLRASAEARGLAVAAVHAAAEALPLADASADLVVVADALHFLDAERAALEIGRALAPEGALAIVTAELGDTPFMHGVVRVMEEAAPRRPRRVAEAITQIAALAGVAPEEVLRFEDATPVDPGTLERILRSISFIGPAMAPERFDVFRRRIHALPGPAVWARALTVRFYRRRRRAAAI